MVAQVHSLLVVVGRESESQVSLRKAVVLARHLGACVDLFLCESEPVTAASEASATRILEALRGSIAADDVIIETSWAGGTSLREGIARRLGDRRPGLVLRSVGGGADCGSRRASAAERELLSGGCRVPLWLARRPAWAPDPRFVVSAGLHAEPCPAWAKTASQLARMLARGSAAHVECLEGPLPGSIDALFLPTPRAGDDTAAARTGRLLDQLDCDLVFVPQASTAGAASQAFSPRRGARALSS